MLRFTLSTSIYRLIYKIMYQKNILFDISNDPKMHELRNSIAETLLFKDFSVIILMYDYDGRFSKLSQSLPPTTSFSLDFVQRSRENFNSNTQI